MKNLALLFVSLFFSISCWAGVDLVYSCAHLPNHCKPKDMKRMPQGTNCIAITAGIQSIGDVIRKNEKEYRRCASINISKCPKKAAAKKSATSKIKQSIKNLKSQQESMRMLYSQFCPMV